MFAIVEFGSTTRCSHDRHSDRDLLVVSEKKSGWKFAKKYQKLGYSVTLLSPVQLIFMQSHGSLFIQHLKHESRTILDTNSEFCSWLESCAFIAPSRKEIQRCISTVEFISSWPSDTRLIGWQADFLYCVSRDLLIKWLAVRDKLAFGLEDLEPALLALNNNRFGSLANLRLLRKLKATYRSKRMISNDTSRTIDSWLSELSSAFGINLPAKQLSSTEEFVTGLVNRSFSSSYELLRTVEAAYHIARSHGYIHPEHEKLMKHIRNPNAYGSSQSRKRIVIERYLQEIIDIMANNGLKQLSWVQARSPT